MPTQFDHLLAGELRAGLLSSDPTRFVGAVGELVAAHNSRRKKGRIPRPGDPSNLATYDERLLGLLWGLTRHVPALVELLRRYDLPYDKVPQASTHLDERDLGPVYTDLAGESLELVWQVSRDSFVLEALWASQQTLDRDPPWDSVLAFRWWHFGDVGALERLLSRLGLRTFVTPDLVERCATPENQARLLERYGQVAIPSGSGSAEEFAASTVAILLHRIRTYWNLYCYRSVRQALPVWVRSRVADTANRDELERDILHKIAAPSKRLNRDPLPPWSAAAAPDRVVGRGVGRTVQDVIRLATLVRNRSRLGVLGWSDEELLELAYANLRWVGIDEPSVDEVREARAVIAEDTAGWGPGAEPTEDEIRVVFGWFPESGPRVAEQIVLRDQLALALDGAVSGLSADEHVAKLREDVLGQMQLAIDWVRDQRRYLQRPVPEFARLLLGAQELWWAISWADQAGERDPPLQSCRVLFELFCRRYRAARMLAPCFLLGVHLSRGLPAGAEARGDVRSSVRGHPSLVQWLEEGRWRDNFELPRSRSTPHRAEAVRAGVVKWLKPRTRLGPLTLRMPRQLLLAWLEVAPTEAGLSSEVTALDCVYWSQADPPNSARWASLGEGRPGPAEAQWPRLDGAAVPEMIQAGCEGAWLRVAGLAGEALPKALVHGDRRWSPGLELEHSLRALSSLHASRRQALTRCRELFGAIPAVLRGELTDLSSCLADDKWWTNPDQAAAPGWHESLEKAAASAAGPVQCALNLLRLWLSLSLRPEGIAAGRLYDLDAVWAESAVGLAEAKGAWAALSGRLSNIVSNAARGNWRAVARLAGNSLADVPDGPGRAAVVFSALKRLAEGESWVSVRLGEGVQYE